MQQSLHSIKIVGEDASSDTSAVTILSKEILKLVGECGYKTKEVFNADYFYFVLVEPLLRMDRYELNFKVSELHVTIAEDN